MPRPVREAMLRGIDANDIIVGAYVDNRSGGICPMLAAHRSGERTSFGTFARAWDEFTGARRARRATRREVRILRTYLEMSLIEEGELQPDSLAAFAEEIRAERRAAASRSESATATDRPADAQRRRPLRRPAPRLDVIEATLAAAEAKLSVRRPAAEEEIRVRRADEAREPGPADRAPAGP